MNYEYYRDILKDIPPACLLYLYKGKINISDVIVAILLNLQMKKVIEIKDNGINFLDDIDIQHERYVIKSIYNGYNDKTFAKEFKEQLLIYLRENNYIYDGDKNKLNITYVMEYFMICMIIYGIELLFVLSSLPNEFRPALLLFIFLAYFLTFVGIPVVKFIQSKILAIIRTDKGIELSGKLQGLYNYLKDFSNINDMEVKNINLYNEYIIYAIIFDMKGTLNNECEQIYQNIKNISSYKKRKTIKN